MKPKNHIGALAFWRCQAPGLLSTHSAISGRRITQGLAPVKQKNL
jgi:hypothetical protein